MTSSVTPPPPPLQISGSFDGTIVDSNAGPGVINLTSTEKSGTTRASLHGTWIVNFPDTGPEGAINDVGILRGTVIGSNITITLVPRRGDALGTCTLILKSVGATPLMFSGTYHFGRCSGTNTGTISVQPGTAPTTVFINVSDNFFFPVKQTISAGQTVRWTNNGFEQHSINANTGSTRCKPASTEAFDSGGINTGQTFDHTFNTPGIFAYHCQIHGCPMKGIITVQ